MIAPPIKRECQVLLTNKDVIKAFIADLKSMHHDDQQPDVVCDFDGDPATLGQIVEIAGKPILRFSYRFADSAVNDHSDLFYCSIIAGHELAHWVNAHTKRLDEDDLDSKAIEIWADFFGTRLAFGLNSTNWLALIISGITKIWPTATSFEIRFGLGALTSRSRLLASRTLAVLVSHDGVELAPQPAAYLFRGDADRF